MIFRLITFLFFCIFHNTYILAQDNSSIQHIIEKTHNLEQEKDPKCYATANRLEDFIYGTPLSEDARNLKIEIQKALIYHIRKEGSKNAKVDNSKKITIKQLTPIVNKISKYTRTSEGNFKYQFRKGHIPILKKDFDQYSSISYAYRSIISL